MSGNNLSVPEIDCLRHDLIDLIAKVNLNRSKIGSTDYRNLMNNLQFSLTVTNNMLNRKLASQGAYGSSGMPKIGLPAARVLGNRSVESVRSSSGSSSSSGSGSGSGAGTNKGTTGNAPEWEKQFQDNLLNPPSYLVPPSNVWNVRGSEL
ncbi:MAG: hypothetical protein ACYCOU_03330 [Sulfobacillus sp.]